MLEKVTSCSTLLAIACAASLSAHAIADTSRNVDVPAGDLAAALQELAKQSGVEFVYSVDQLKGVRTIGVRGEYTAEKAVTKLLEGTKLKLTVHPSGALLISDITPGSAFGNESSAGNSKAGRAAQYDGSKRSLASRLRLAQAAAAPSTGASARSGQNVTSDDARPRVNQRSEELLEEVTVFGRGVKETVREVPQTVDVFGVEFIETIQADVVDDVLRFVPNSFVANWSPPLYTSFIVRGFPASQTYNGLGYQFTTNARTPANMANVERVEVLKGPASVLYGTMEPGAVINLVTKRPLSDLHAEGSLKYGTYNDANLQLDIGGPLSERIGARLNVAYSRTDTVFDNAGTVEDIFIAPVIEFDVTDSTSLILDGYYDKFYWPNGWTDGRMPVALVGGGMQPSALPQFPQSTNFLYDRDITGNGSYGDLEETRKALEVNARLSHDFSSTLSFNAVFSYHRDQRYEETIFPLDLMADNRTLRREYWVSDDPPGSSYVAHLDLRGELTTGPINHKWMVGVDHNDGEFEVRSGDVEITPIDIFDPVYGTIVLPEVFRLRHVERSTKISDVFVQDRLGVGKWSFILGARRSDYDQRTQFTPFGRTSTRSGLEDTIWSTQLGALYDVNDWVTLFASRNESFVPKRFVNSQGTQVDDPEISVQYEAGAKFQFAQTGLVGNLSYFYVEKNDVLVADPQNPSLSVPIGQLTSDGIEASIEGRPAPGLTLLVSYGYNVTEITEASANVGNRFRNSPKHTFALFTRYDVQTGPLAGFGISGSLNHVGERWASDENTIEFPPYTRIDLGAHYPLAQRYQFDLYLQNLTGAKVIDGFGSSFARYTKDRTAFGKLSVRF